MHWLRSQLEGADPLHGASIVVEHLIIRFAGKVEPEQRKAERLLQ